MAKVMPTTDHHEIRRWAAVSGAVPVEIGGYLHDGTPTQIGFIFPKGAMKSPEFKAISWDNFFALFDLMGLSLVCDDGSYELLQTEAQASPGFSAGPS